MFKDLHGHPVLKWDAGHVGSVLSPHMVGFMKPGKLRKKKRAPAINRVSGGSFFFLTQANQDIRRDENPKA